jgi:hypothetical protein
MTGCVVTAVHSSDLLRQRWQLEVLLQLADLQICFAAAELLSNPHCNCGPQVDEQHTIEVIHTEKTCSMQMSRITR